MNRLTIFISIIQSLYFLKFFLTTDKLFYTSSFHYSEYQEEIPFINEAPIDQEAKKPKKPKEAKAAAVTSKGEE